MGGSFDKCCGGNGKPQSSSRALPVTLPSDGREARQDRQFVNAFSGVRTASIAHKSKGEDSAKFDRAYESSDVQAFVELLSSQQQIDSFEERMHPWAANPKTVGALAATQLAIIASTAEKDKPHAKEQIGRAGAIAPLVTYLRTEEDDRVQIAVVALSFLTTECMPNAVAAFSEGAMPLLLPHLASPICGMQSAAAMTLCNFCNEREEYRKTFVELGGIGALVAQLGSAADPALNMAEVQLECVLNLQDIIEDDSGDVIQAYAHAAIEAGAVEKLEGLKTVEDSEMRDAVSDLLRCLSAEGTG